MKFLLILMVAVSLNAKSLKECNALIDELAVKSDVMAKSDNRITHETNIALLDAKGDLVVIRTECFKYLRNDEKKNFKEAEQSVDEALSYIKPFLSTL